MGFMDKLKEIGLGNTGPRGNMNSGATNYANYAKERQSTEAQRGISQALALASKNGKQMPYTVFTDIAKKWNVPVEMVAEPGRNINAGNYRTEVKNQSRDFMEALKIKKDEEAAQGNPKWVPDEGWITNYGMDNGIYPETRGILKDWAVKDKEAKRTKLSQGDVLVESLTGKKIASNEKQPTEDKTMVDVTSPDGTRTASIPRKHLQKYLKAGYTEGKVNTPAGGGKPKDAQTWVLPNLDTVRSFDGGRTYIGKDGKRKPMPTEGAYKINAQFSGTDIAALKSRQGAGAEAKTVNTETKPGGAKAAAISGTGLYANLGAAIDATLGGVGIDALLGKEGFFKDTQDARQKLRLIKQLGKTAFMNSSRGAIWEQQKIDKLFPNPTDLFANPRTEARKFVTLRQSLLTEKRFNLEAIAASGDPKEISKFKASNADINKLLAHIGSGESGSGSASSDDALIQKYLNK